MGDMKTQGSHTSYKFCDILQHVVPYFRQDDTDLESICSLLQVSTAVRHTVQSSRAQCSIAVGPDYISGGLCMRQQLAAAMRWLPRHAGLVSELIVQHHIDDQASVPFTLLEQALQLCAQNAALASLTTAGTTAAPPAAAAAGAAHGTHSSCTSSAAYAGSVVRHRSPGCPLPLCLKSVSLESIPPPAVLRLLQSAGVQTLQLGLKSADMPLGTFPALASMQQLTDLKLICPEHLNVNELPVAMAAAVGQLQHLTSFSVYGLTPVGSRLLPVSLRELELRIPCVDSSSGNGVSTGAADAHLVDLSHLTTLTFLIWESYGVDEFDITLPAQAVKLSSFGRLHLVGPLNLPEVNIVTSKEDGRAWEVLLQLASTAHTRDLEFNFDGDLLSREDFQQVGTALGALTNLTALKFSVLGGLHKLQHAHLLQQLRKLPSLSNLSLEVDDGPHGDQIVDVSDMLQLSALTNLTQLHVWDFSEAGFGTTAAPNVASLTQLQELELRCCNLQTMEVLPAVARLTGLRSLDLDRYDDARTKTPSDLEPALLQQLTSLTLLTSLHLWSQRLSGEDRQRFLAGMPSLTCFVTARAAALCSPV